MLFIIWITLAFCQPSPKELERMFSPIKSFLSRYIKKEYLSTPLQELQCMLEHPIPGITSIPLPTGHIIVHSDRTRTLHVVKFAIPQILGEGAYKKVYYGATLNTEAKTGDLVAFLDNNPKQGADRRHLEHEFNILEEIENARTDQQPLKKIVASTIYAINFFPDNTPRAKRLVTQEIGRQIHIPHLYPTKKRKYDGTSQSFYEIYDFAQRLAEALLTLKQAQIVHNDLREINIIKNKQKELRIIDFSISFNNKKILFNNSYKRIPYLSAVDILAPETMSYGWTPFQDAPKDINLFHARDIYAYGTILAESLFDQKVSESQTECNQYMEQIVYSDDLGARKKRLLPLYTCIFKYAQNRFEQLLARTSTPCKTSHKQCALERLVTQCLDPSPSNRPTTEQLYAYLFPET